MYIPRGKLLALVTIVAAAALVTGTGAFSTVETKRTAEVEVAGDKNAYLGLAPHDGDNSNGQFAHQNNNGKLQIQFNQERATEAGGQGVNPESITTFDNVFTITNQGTQDVEVTVTDEEGKEISVYDSETGDEINKKSIDPGSTIDVGITIDASDKTAGDGFTEDITIKAESPEAANTDESLPDSSSGSSSNSNSGSSSSGGSSNGESLSGPMRAP